MDIAHIPPHRFHERTRAISLKRLEHETNRLLASGLVLAVALHAALFSFVRFDQTVPRIPRPMPVELIIRRPRMTRPLVISRPDAARRELQRRVTARMPNGVLTFQSLPTAEEIIRLAEELEVVLSPAEIREMVAGVIAGIAETDRQLRATALDSIYRERFPVEIAEYLKGIEREAKNVISLRESFLNIDDLDTGQYRGLVIKDPADKQNVAGFIHIPSAIWGVQLGQQGGGASTLFPPETGKMAVIGMVDGFHIYTNIEMTLDGQLYIDSPRLQDYPIVYISADRSFDTTRLERESLGAYLQGGGFALVEPFSEAAFYSLSQMIEDALGNNNVRRIPVPADHEILHCFYDFENPTVRIEGEDVVVSSTMFQLDGFFKGDRLVALMLTGDYGAAWAARSYENPYFRLAVNAVVYSLIRQGSVARQYISGD